MKKTHSRSERNSQAESFGRCPTDSVRASTNLRRVGLRALLIAVVGSGLALPTPARAGQSVPDQPAKIRDNLFLLEEAYNQEPRTIQHIQSFTLSPRTQAWNYSFTDEWPVPGDRHQLSITVPACRLGETPSAALGDLMLNYRVQAIGAGSAGALAMAPRISLALPTGGHPEASRGVTGLQLNLPVSVELGSRFVTHLNAGVTVAPGVRVSNGDRQTALDTNAGAALVWLPLTWANALVEVAHLTSEELVANRAGLRHSTVVVNPGVRFAINFKSGLQIVPGISAPIQFRREGREVSGLVYLSFEHRAW